MVSVSYMVKRVEIFLIWFEKVFVGKTARISTVICQSENPNAVHSHTKTLEILSKALQFESLHQEMLKCHTTRQTESYLAILSCGAIYYEVKGAFYYIYSLCMKS